MEWIFHSQKLVLLNNSPWFAFAFITYSFLNSWHCSVMCGGLIFDGTRAAVHRTLLWRLISYSAMGALMGYFGQALIGSAEYKLLAAVGFVAMVAVSLTFLFPWLYGKLFAPIRRMGERQLLRSHPRVRGLLIAAMPCHLLATCYGIAVLSGSAVLGALILFSHAVMTTPSLAYSWSRILTATKRWAWPRRTLKIVLAIMMFVNLMYFGARLFGPEADIEQRILFCI